MAAQRAGSLEGHWGALQHPKVSRSVLRNVGKSPHPHGVLTVLVMKHCFHISVSLLFFFSLVLHVMYAIHCNVHEMYVFQVLFTFWGIHPWSEDVCRCYIGLCWPSTKELALSTDSSVVAVCVSERYLGHCPPC